MNKLFLVIFLAGCSSFGDRLVSKMKSMPEVNRKMNSLESTCMVDAKNKILNIYFKNRNEAKDFCTCMLTGFGGFQDFAPMDEQHIQTVMNQFDANPDHFVIESMEKMQKGYFDYRTALQNLSRNESWKTYYEKNYSYPVSYCRKNAKYGVAI